MRCAERPVGFDAKAWGVLPKPVRDRLTAVVGAGKRNADRLDRTINYLKPHSC